MLRVVVEEEEEVQGAVVSSSFGGVQVEFFGILVKIRTTAATKTATKSKRISNM
jgi:hypothetical protein